MDNEATKIVENEKEMNQSVQNGQQPKVVVEKQGGMAGRLAATAAGVVIGSGAAIAGEKLYNQYMNDDEKSSAGKGHDNVDVSEEDDVREEQTDTDVTDNSGETEHNVEHVIVEHHVYTHNEETPQVITEIGPKVTVVNEPLDDEISDDEVHVVGVAVEDNGMGGMAMYAGLQVGEDQAIVVDIDSNGTIDLVGIDENMNGQLEEDEWHVVEDGELDTADVLEAYMEEAEAKGEAALVANLDTGETMQLMEDEESYYVTSLDESDDTTFPEDSLYYTSGDDNLPDYMNGADTEMFES